MPDTQLDRAVERIADDSPVDIEVMPKGDKTVQGPVGRTPVRSDEALPEGGE